MASHHLSWRLGNLKMYFENDFQWSHWFPKSLHLPRTPSVPNSLWSLLGMILVLGASLLWVLRRLGGKSSWVHFRTGLSFWHQGTGIQAALWGFSLTPVKYHDGLNPKKLSVLPCLFQHDLHTSSSCWPHCNLTTHPSLSLERAGVTGWHSSWTSCEWVTYWLIRSTKQCWMHQWVTPFPGGDQPRPSENTDIHLMTHNSSRITVMEKQREEFYGWGSPRPEELCSRVAELEGLGTAVLLDPLLASGIRLPQASLTSWIGRIDKILLLKPPQSKKHLYFPFSKMYWSPQKNFWW